MNELSRETSPYLLQHANNPVHWKAWNAQTLELAKSQDKLIILSSGYSACHWCHVMEHESFEDNEVAEAMNRNFISIKVDREERPDIDAVYMKAVQIMTGQGGWPMNVVCFPDGRPVWGGTYFRKNQWIDSLDQLAEMYRREPGKMLEYAERLQQGIETISLIEARNPEAELSQDIIEPLISKWKKSFDTEFGGYARAPKFMLPSNWEFLMRYGHQHNDKELLDQVNLTLGKMATGGLFDTVGGGFSRYSVDMKWHVPHFEKMLYDNGQLVSLYADAFKLTQNPLYKETIEKTLAFVNRELSNGESGFYSALDADSLDEKGHLEEGAFYVWTKPELQEILGDDFNLFSEVFSIDDFGHWENGKYVLIQKDSLEVIANRKNLSVSELQSRKILWENKLFAIRENRPKPRLDDKCLTSWNAIMNKGFSDAAKALSNEEYLKTAIKNAEFIVAKLWSPDGHLFRNYKNGNATINGYLEDYAHTIDCFISLYTATLGEKWLQYAKQLCDYCFDHFYDETAGFFRFTSDLDDRLIAPHFEVEDNVISASNSVMAENLFALGIYYGNSHYEEIAWKMTAHIVPTIDYPSAFSNWLNVFLNFSNQNRELAICAGDALQQIGKLNRLYLPNLVVAGCDKASKLPFLENRFADDQTLFYVCENKTCGLPDKEFDRVITQLKNTWT